MSDTVLVINCGSSSIKVTLYERDANVVRHVEVEAIGENNPLLVDKSGESERSLGEPVDHQQALLTVTDYLREINALNEDPKVVGHRVVHGGERFRKPVLIDQKTLEEIRQCEYLAPLHNPLNLMGIDAAIELFSEVPQVAVFDTAFHYSLPKHAYLYGLPLYFYKDWGVRRYGFHGISHQYITEQCAVILNQPMNKTSIISAHLGNGCSVTAIQDGLSVDTSMGLTPLEGLIMGSRSGDVDPGLFDFVAQKGISAEQFNAILNHDSGLKGLSGISNDMRELERAAREGRQSAVEAINVFCYRLARYIGAMMVALKTLDALVFTGGIGENSALVREKTIAHLTALGFVLDPLANHNNDKAKANSIAAPNSRFPVYVIATNEEQVIARAAYQLAVSHA